MSIKKYHKGFKESAAIVADTATLANQATKSTQATNISGGSEGSIVVQSKNSGTAFAPKGKPGQVLQVRQDATNYNSVYTPYQWVSPATLGAQASPTFFWGSYGSTDGLTWTQAVGEDKATLAQAAYGNGRFVDVDYDTVSSKYPGVSTDLVSWTASSTGFTYARLIGFALSKFFIVHTAGQSSMSYSTDGLTWTSVSRPFYASYPKLASNGTTAVLVGTQTSGGSQGAISSTDGITWTTRALPVRSGYAYDTFIAASPSMYVIMSRDYLATSTDGAAWTQGTAPAFGGSASISGLAYGNGLFITGTTDEHSYATSTDGITWTSRSANPSIPIGKIIYSNGVFVSIPTNDSSGGTRITTDGVTWKGTVTTSLHPNFQVSSSVFAISRPLTPQQLTGEVSRTIVGTSYTLSPTDKWVRVNSTANCTLTLPSAAFNTNRELVIRQTAAYTVISSASNVIPLTSSTPGTAILSGAGKFARLISDGTYWIIMEAN